MQKTFPADYIYNSDEAVPHCPCGGIVRCDVTLYEEQLPERDVAGAVSAISSADMLIIGGTSLTVYPAASYIRYFNGEHLVIINKEPLAVPLNPHRDLEINLPIGEVFSKLR